MTKAKKNVLALYLIAAVPILLQIPFFLYFVRADLSPAVFRLVFSFIGACDLAILGVITHSSRNTLRKARLAENPPAPASSLEIWCTPIMWALFVAAALLIALVAVPAGMALPR